MTQTEKLLLISCGVLIGTVIYLYNKLNRLKCICMIQQDNMQDMAEYINNHEEWYNND